MENNLTRKQRFIATLATIGGIVLLGSLALAMGRDGQILAATVGALAGIGGWSIRAIKVG